MQNGVAIALVVGTALITHLATRVYFPESAGTTAPRFAAQKLPRVLEQEPCPDFSESAASHAAPNSDPCDACLVAASSGNIVRAASAFSECSHAGRKSACQAAARSKAQSTVQAQAFNGQCDQAKATARAGAAMGIERLDRTIAKSSCR